MLHVGIDKTAVDSSPHTTNLFVTRREPSPEILLGFYYDCHYHPRRFQYLLYNIRTRNGGVQAPLTHKAFFLLIASSLFFFLTREEPNALTVFVLSMQAKFGM